VVIVTHLKKQSGSYGYFSTVYRVCNRFYSFCSYNRRNGIVMRNRIKFKVNVQEYVERSNAERERRRTIFTNAIQSIVKEKNVQYNEAKLLLTAKLRLDVMNRCMQMVS
jgi:coproporphyrinogen III oxidase-like Fe-S oxidoreductase